MRQQRLAVLTFGAAILASACSGGGAGTSTSPRASAGASAGGTAAATAPTTTAAPTTSADAGMPSMTHSMGSGSPMASESPMGTESPAPSATTDASPSESAGAGGIVTDSKAADLRTRLNYLLGEHIFLASKATGAALGGRNEEFAAYGELLNTNGTDLGSMVGTAFGDEAKDSFNKIWSAHNGFFVDYTTGVAKKDKAMQDKAVNDLTTVYVPQFSEFLSGATDLPKEAVAQLTTEHVLTTKAIVDAQASKDAKAAAAADRLAAQHMQMIGDPLAKAIVAKLPAKFS